MIERVEESKCHIDLLLMSYRVLKRGIEFSTLDDFLGNVKKKCI